VRLLLEHFGHYFFYSGRFVCPSVYNFSYLYTVLACNIKLGNYCNLKRIYIRVFDSCRNSETFRKYVTCGEELAKVYYTYNNVLYTAALGTAANVFILGLVTGI